jgi:hypothetical protein
MTIPLTIGHMLVALRLMVFFFASILPTAFMGTAMIFTCFTLSALYARRRSYLFLGGRCRVGSRERGSALARILTRILLHLNSLVTVKLNLKAFIGIALFWLLSR